MRHFQPMVVAAVLAISVCRVCPVSADEDRNLPHKSNDKNDWTDKAESQPRHEDPTKVGAAETQTEPLSLADAEEQLARLRKERIQKLESLVATLKSYLQASRERNHEDIRALLDAEYQLLEAKLSFEADSGNRIRMIEQAIKDSEKHVPIHRPRITERQTTFLYAEIRSLSLKILLLQHRVPETKGTGTHPDSELKAAGNTGTYAPKGSNLDPELRELLQQRRDVLRQHVTASKTRTSRELEKVNDHLKVLKSLVEVELELATSVPEAQQACEKYVVETEFLAELVEARIAQGFGGPYSLGITKDAVLEAKILRARLKRAPQRQ